MIMYGAWFRLWYLLYEGSIFIFICSNSSMHSTVAYLYSFVSSIFMSSVLTTQGICGIYDVLVISQMDMSVFVNTVKRYKQSEAANHKVCISLQIVDLLKTTPDSYPSNCFDCFLPRHVPVTLKPVHGKITKQYCALVLGWVLKCEHTSQSSAGHDVKLFLRWVKLYQIGRVGNQQLFVNAPYISVDVDSGEWDQALCWWRGWRNDNCKSDVIS